MRKRKYSKQEIQFFLQQAWDAEVDLRTRSINKNKKWQWLYRYSFNYFQTWRQALESINLSYEMVKNRAHKARIEELIIQINLAYKHGVDLSSAKIRNSQHRWLYDKARANLKGKLFWENLLLAAHIPKEKIQRDNLWNFEKIQDYLKNSQKIDTTSILRKNRPLYKAAFRMFKQNNPPQEDYSWQSVLKYFGITNPEKKIKFQNWENGKKMQELLEIFFPHGVIIDLSSKHIFFYSAIRRFFNSPGEVANKFNFVLAHYGKIDEKDLKIPEIKENLIKLNHNFLLHIVKKNLHKFARFNQNILKQEILLLKKIQEFFIEVLPQKPRYVDLTSFLQTKLDNKLSNYIYENYFQKNKPHSI